MKDIKQIKRASKDAFRKVTSHLPQGVKRYMTGRYISRRTEFLLPIAQLRECEANPERREEIIQAHKLKHPKQVKLLEKKIQEAGKHAAAGIAFPSEDVEYAYFAYGFPPEEYVYYRLADKDIRTYVSDTERYCAKLAMNDFTQSVFADKGKVYSFFKKWYKRDAVVLEYKSDFPKYEAFVSTHPTYVVKIVNSSRGKGVWLESASDDHEKDFLKIIKHGKVLLEEKIKQNEILGQFNSSSVNTARVCTYLTHEGVIPAHGTFRTGRKGNFVDNAGSGGILAALDTEKGVVVSDGVDKSGMRYPVHPNSNMKYDGFVLPEWDKALEIVREATLIFPEVKYKSFDLAYSDKGWVIVEINPSGEISGKQASSQSGMKEMLRKLLDDMDLLYPYSLR